MGGRRPSSSDAVEKPVRKGPWSTLEDQKLSDYVTRHGHGNWKALPGLAGLNRCGKSCRLRWVNYLRPEIKRGKFSPEEESLIVHLHSQVGNRWSNIAAHLPGRTDNEIKNFWNTQLKKKLIRTGIDPETHMPLPRDPHEHLLAQLLTTPTYNWQVIATELAKLQMLNTLMETIRTLSSTPFLAALDSSISLGPNYPLATPAAVELPEYPPGANPSNSSVYQNTLPESSPESSPDINSMFDDLDKLMEEDMTFLKEIFD